jgi:uncharacterized repeat protein (TIGR03803 family)
MTRIESRGVFALALLVLIAVVATAPSYAQDFSVVYDFGSRSGDPANPLGSIAQGRDGALYGTSLFGGANGVGGVGAVFKVTPGGQARVLYSFCAQANCADGEYPFGGLTLRPNGHFLGTTQGGGTYNFGTIFDISEAGTLTVLYSFTGGADGSYPMAAPIEGPGGEFYGTASTGGISPGCGTIYRFTAPGNVVQVVHSFDRTDGCAPQQPLVWGTDGNFYGTTLGGGTSGFGILFQSTPTGSLTVLHDFGVYNSETSAPLIQGDDGNFYGTTVGDTDGTIGGTVFQITPGGTYTVLHTLNGTTEGSRVLAGLVQATDGNFYGVASQGGNSTNCPNGASDCGTLFQVTPGGSFSVLYNFDSTTGYSPGAAPFQHTNGVLYGDTQLGGPRLGSQGGVFYSWSASLPAFVSFVPDRGKVGSFVEILGQGFTSSTAVSFNGTPATATVVSGTYLKATVPSGATTGFVTVTTSNGTLTSNKQFIVTP